jgi:hypothetical protein
VVESVVAVVESVSVAVVESEVTSEPVMVADVTPTVIDSPLSELPSSPESSPQPPASRPTRSPNGKPRLRMDE